MEHDVWIVSLSTLSLGRIKNVFPALGKSRSRQRSESRSFIWNQSVALAAISVVRFYYVWRTWSWTLVRSCVLFAMSLIINMNMQRPHMNFRKLGKGGVVNMAASFSIYVLCRTPHRPIVPLARNVRVNASMALYWFQEIQLNLNCSYRVHLSFRKKALHVPKWRQRRTRLTGCRFLTVLLLFVNM